MQHQHIMHHNAKMYGFSNKY